MKGKGTRVRMTDQVIIFIQQYVEWGIFSIGCIAVLTLWRMSGHLKKLNRELSGMSGKMHEYFSVIMEEEDEELVSAKEKSDFKFVPKEEKEIHNFRNKEKAKEEDAVIQSVLQEYFS